jgi:polysaccharide biosynthesis protein PslE
MLSNQSSSSRDALDAKKLIIDFEPGFSLRDALNVLFCHKWKIILFFCTVVSSISVSTYRMPYFYSSEAKLLIGVGRDPNTISPILNPSQYLNQNQQERVNNEVIILKSKILAERVVNIIGYEPFLKKRKPTTDKPSSNHQDTQHVESNEKNSTEKSPKSETKKDEKRDKDLWNFAVGQVANSLTVELKALSFVISVTITLRDPVLAQTVLKTLLEVYVNRHIELNDAKAVEVFRQRHAISAQELHKKEEALSQFKIENNIAKLDEQKNTVISRMGELTSSINSAEAKSLSLNTKIADLEELLTHYTKFVVSQTTRGKTNYVADALKNLLIKLKNQEIELSSRYPDDSRKVTEVRDQIALVEKYLDEEPDSKEEPTESLNQTYEHFSRQLEESKIELNSQQSGLKKMKEQLNTYQELLNKFISYEVVLSRLERELEAAKKEFQIQSEVLQKADSYKNLNESKITSIDIIEPPTFFAEPVKPDKPKNIILGIVLGLFGGIGLAFFLDYFDDSMKTNEDVKRHLKLPVLAMITTNEFERLCNE